MMNVPSQSLTLIYICSQINNNLRRHKEIYNDKILILALELLTYWY